MVRKFLLLLLLSLVLNSVLPATLSPADDDDDDDLDSEDLESGEETSPAGLDSNDDDGRIYKNPRNSPSALCPRDEDQATLLGQKCLRKCSSDEDCKSKKKKCLCDGACGMSCIKPVLPATLSPADDDDDDDLDSEDLESGEETSPAGLDSNDDDGRIYKNPRNSPSALCPRDEDQATLLGQKCLRKCSSDEDCKSKKKKCLCDGACGMSCIKPVLPATLSPADDDDDDDLDSEDLESGEETSPAGLDSNDDDGRIYKNPRNSPSALCPRDEDQATLLGQKCLRKCSSDEDCKSKKKKCLCDGACGMSCIKPDRECPELSDPELGRVTVTGRLFGDRATYTCQHGYHVVGLQSRTCQADGQWAGAQPACKQNIYCLSPPNIDHARHNALPEQTTFDLDSTLQYYCHTGYATNGFPRAKCLAIEGQASWYGPDITCEPRSCGPPSDIAHGWHSGECYTFGCRVTYLCADGFELVGRAERFCQADGTWAPKELPTCVPVQCSPPENPRNGKAIYTSCSYNSVVSYECKYGYTLVGNVTRRCGADKKWTGAQPVCKEINCGHPGRLWNGWLENIEAGTGLGASIIFRCHDNMRLEGHTSTVCQIDGTWRYPLPKCLAPCVVPQVSEGKVNLMLRSNDSATLLPNAATVVQHGEMLTVECQANYEFPQANHAPVTCNNGTWTLIPRCLPARCKHMPKPPKNGMVIAPKTDHGMRARFRCKDGYTLRGHHFVECSFGNWTGEIPYCQEVYCPFPGYIENGKVLLVGNMGLYDYRPYVRKVTNNKQIMYDCDKGYVLLEGPPGATCIGGHWSPKDLPRCVPGQHPRLRWSRRRRSILLDRYRKKLLGSKAVFLYRRRRQALSNKKTSWDTFLKKIQNRGRRSPKLGATTGVRQPANNLKNLRRNNNENRKQNRGRKKQSFEKEKIKIKNRSPCEDISNEPYVNVEFVKQGKDPNVTFSAGTVVRVACGKGYGLNLEVNTTAKCVKGRWKPEKPVCSIIPCHVPLTPNGFYKLSESEQSSSTTILLPSDTNSVLNDTADVLNGQVVEFSCAPGYNIQGPSNLRCWLGEWASTSFPRCLAAPCQLPQITNGQYLSGYRPGLMIANGSSVTFQCDSDYSKSTAQPVECILGELYPRTPACKQSAAYVTPEGPHYLGGSDIIKGGDISVLDFRTGMSRSCGPPARVQGSLVYRDGEPIVEDERSFPDGTEVTFHCIESIMGEKTTWRIICEDGSWIGRSLNCDADEMISSSIITNNNTCTFRNQEPNVVSFYNDQLIREDIVEFPPGAVLISRCVDIGKYSMIGSNHRRCIGGEWDGQKPACFGLNQENDYAMAKAPTILFRHENGPIAQSNDGKLIVYPGTILHMECLWIRRFGNPKWNVSHDYRKYPEGWTTDPGRDSGLEYRLSIYHAAKEVYLYHAREAVACCGTKMFTTLFCKFSCTGAVLISRCVDIGKYSMIGSNHRRCIGGEWDGQKPACFGLNQENDYAMAKAPTILFRHENGPIAQSNDGKLIVYPGTILHMECLWIRRFGNPKWNVSHDYRKYPEGWTTDPGRDSGLEYRLSIYHAAKDDSGLFTCITPARQSHAVDIVVKTVHCPVVPHRRGLTVNSESTKMNTRLQFSCINGNSLIGASEIVCLPSGNWSAPFPICESVECGEVGTPGSAELGPHSRVSVVSREVGGRAVFSCTPGYGLRGPHETVCLSSGDWATPFPTCAEVQCDIPGIPENGYMQGTGPFKAGDVVQFNCNPDFMMEGQPIIACQDNSRWSGPLPKCVQACSYPGTTISGRMSAVKFFYKIGENITFTCDEGLTLRGAAMLKCLRNGKWSNAIPTCVTSSSNSTATR